MSIGTIETKVIAAAAGSGVGAATGGFLLWLAGVLIWHQPDAASAAASTVAAVPTPVSGLVLILLAVAGSAVSGYAAPHTNRTTTASSGTTGSGAGSSNSLSGGQAVSGADPIQVPPGDFLTSDTEVPAAAEPAPSTALPTDAPGAHAADASPAAPPA